MATYEDNVSINHMDCLAALGWLAFDTTHMGDPDSYLMTPCCPHGYRAVFSPRPVLDYVKARHSQNYGQGVSIISDQTQLQQLGQT